MRRRSAAVAVSRVRLMVVGRGVVGKDLGLVGVVSIVKWPAGMWCPGRPLTRGKWSSYGRSKL